jgi:endonuclease III-like uncharacterized protein
MINNPKFTKQFTKSTQKLENKHTNTIKFKPESESESDLKSEHKSASSDSFDSFYEFSVPRDMSQQWSPGAHIVNISTPNGAHPTIRIDNRYIVIHTIEKVFDKPTISITASAFLKKIDETYNEIKHAFEEYFINNAINNAINNTTDTVPPNLEWTSPIIDSVAKASFTKQTVLKSIGNLAPRSPFLEEIENTTFSAFVVLTMPVIFYNTKTLKASIPIHVRSIGVVDICDDFKNIDVSRLKLAE